MRREYSEISLLHRLGLFCLSLEFRILLFFWCVCGGVGGGGCGVAICRYFLGSVS